MIESGCDLFQSYHKEITCIYGEASSGKTTFAELAAIEQAKKNKKIVYIDTENGFNLERIKQLAGDEFQNVLENIILFKPGRFSEQNRIIKKLPEMKNISLIVIDTISNHYRVKVREKPDVYNLHMWKQFKILNELSKNVPVIITNQVYSNIKKKNIEMIGGERFRKYSNRIIRLENNPRKLIFEKPSGDFVKFEIKSNGVFKLENKIN
ncbi:AAA family ATPase [Candidatus Woesearchaeota archaeon]|nr:AAA family ATPase [Candidatus Woesearchaeota archaeon]